MTWFDKLDVWAPLRTYPRAAARGYTRSHLEKGKGYQEGFRRLPGRRMIWDLEQRILTRFVQEWGPWNRCLDFAAGTGRIAGLTIDACSEQYLLDVSPTMLEVAKARFPGAIVRCGDFRDGTHDLPDGEFGLVTAFRFFPNAEPDLREAAMAFTASKVAPGGWVVCNNHRNFWSIPYLAQRAVFYRGGSGGMRNQEMIALAKRHGLSLVRQYALGVVPQTERFAILPWKVVAAIERALLNGDLVRHGLGYNVIFIFRRH